MTPKESIQELEYSEALSDAYVDYAMSVITARSVPDVRDGLKPVQRRVLWDMKDLGFYHNKPYMKTARVSGDTIGRWHPHGDSSVNSAIETMAQTFKKPYALIDGQGNWGSPEGDSAAAARYTECRLTEFAEDAYLNLLDSDTVDFVPNYDSTLKEPSVLPAKVPMVLLTGCDGIAVGMATKIPTFNLNEVVKANELVLKNPDASIKDVLKVMPGPDFVSGGILCNPEDMKQIYESGKGRIRLRAKFELEKGSGRSKDYLVVTEVPEPLIGESCISCMQKIVDLMERKELPGVTDLQNRTKDSVCFALELSKDADVQYVIDVLLSKTPLETTFSCSLLVIDDKTPKTLGVLDVLKSYSKFQKEIYSRKYEHDLKKLKSRLEILEAFKTCCDRIEETVELIKSSKSVQDARTKLMDKFSLNENQASAVLSMKLSKLVSLESEAVIKELNQVKESVKDCEKVLSDESVLVKRIVSDIRSLARKHGNERRTSIESHEPASYVKREQEASVTYVLGDKFLYFHRIDEAYYERYKDSIESDYKHVCKCMDNESVYAFASDGFVYRIKASDIPFGGLRHKGAQLSSVRGSKFPSSGTSLLLVSPSDVSNVACFTRKGKCKRLENKEAVTSRSKICYMPLSDGDEVAAVLSPSKEYIETFSSVNRTSKFNVSDVPFKNRGSKGVSFVSLRSPNEAVTDVFETDDGGCSGPIGCTGRKMTSSQIDILKAYYIQGSAE